MLGPRERFVLGIAKAALPIVIQKLKEKAVESKTPVDDFIIGLAEAMLPMLTDEFLAELLH